MGNPGIEVDVEVLLDGKPVVTLLAPVVNPSLEVLADPGEDDVAEVGPGHLLALSQGRQRVDHGPEAQTIVEDESN